MRIDKHRIQDKGQGYFIARSNAVIDATLLGVASNYRTNTSRNYLPLTAADITKRFSSDRAILISTKYDGEAVFIHFNAEDKAFPEFAFSAPSGRVRIGLPCIAAAVKKIQAAGHTRGLFAAELYLPRKEAQQRPTVADAIRASFSDQAHDWQALTLAFYDIIMLDGQDWRKHEDHFRTTWDKLQALFGQDETSLAHCVAGQIIPEQKVLDAFHQRTEAEEEGIVVRRLDSPDIYKIKPSITIDGVIIGYVEDSFDNHFGVASVLIGLTGPDRTMREFARVGSGFTDAQRIHLLKELSQDKIKSPLAKTDSDGRPITFVKPRILVEIQGENLESENLSGRENVMPVYSFTDNTYTFYGLQAMPRLTHATFVQFRDDKSLSEGGARQQQVLGEDVPALTATATRSQPATIQRRSVYTKTTKGQTAIRKFLLIETDGQGRYPYIILYTDVSLGRKQPIQHTHKVAFSRSHADMLFDNLLAENIKKGWISYE